jgi:hypothetical protein
MPVPVVSHESWEKVRGFAQIALGTKAVDVKEMSFSEQLQQLMAGPGGKGTYHERVDSMKEDPSGFNHTEWEDGVKVLIRPHEREKVHRPRISEKLEEGFTERAMDEYPGMIIGELSFDTKLQLFLERVDTYYSYLDCELVNDTRRLSEDQSTA